MSKLEDYINSKPDRHWFDYPDFYTEIADKTKDGDVLVEIGNHYGASSLFLADKIKHKKAKLYLVDNSTGGRASLKQYVKDNNVSNIEFIDEDSLTAHEYFNHKSIDFLFIDGCHEYSHVRKDIAFWNRKVKNSGIMAGHDFYLTTDVKFAVEQHIPAHLLSVRQTTSGYGVWIRDNNIFKLGKFSRNFSIQSRDFIIYIPYVNRIDLLKRAIESQKKYINKILVINQSGSDISKEIPDVAIFDMNDMHFTCMQNFAQSLAKYYSLGYLIFQHNDCYVTGDAVEKMIEQVRSNPRAGVVFTHYDALCLFDMNIVNRVGCWDESFNWYVADVDYYQRIKFDGFNHSSLDTGIVHHDTSQTIKSLPQDKLHEVKINQDWAWRHYVHKWGGGQNNESNKMPYNGKP